MSIFDPEKIARNKAIVDAMPAWKRGEPINERRLTEAEKLKAVNTQLLEALKAALRWIDAVPSNTQLPTMPGFDRDEVDAAIQAAEVQG